MPIIHGSRMTRVLRARAICLVVLVIVLMTSRRDACAQWFPQHPGSVTVTNPFVITQSSGAVIDRLPVIGWPSSVAEVQAETPRVDAWRYPMTANTVAANDRTAARRMHRLPVTDWPKSIDLSTSSVPVHQNARTPRVDVRPTWRNASVPYIPVTAIIQEQLPPIVQPQVEAVPLQPPTPNRTPAPERRAPIQPRTNQPSTTRPAPAAPTDQPERPNGPIGEAPEEEDVTTQFLRRSSLVLQPGSWQIDLGLLYGWQQTDLITVLPPGVPVFERVRNRSFIVPLNVRYGLTPKVEVFAGMPLGMSILEYANPLNEDTTIRGPQGDLSFGGVFEIAKAKDEMPDITATFTATAPTGGDPTFGRSVASLGNGFWSLSAGLNFVKSYDPIALFGGFGLRHSFQEEVLGGIQYQPGETFFYSSGAAFGVNNDISLTASFNGSYSGKSRLDGRATADSSSEAMSLQFGIVKRVKRDLRMQPFVSFGLTPDAQDASIGVIFTRDVESTSYREFGK